MTEIYAAIEVLSSEFSVVKLCRILGVSRSAYYSYVNGTSYVLKEEKQAISQAIKKVFERHKKRYGWRRIQSELADEGWMVGWSASNPQSDGGTKFESDTA